MTEAPERIWLQDDGDYEGARDAMIDTDTGVTWCDTQINDNDTEYVRADRIEALEAENARLHSILDDATSERQHPVERMASARADLAPGWSTDMEAAPKDGTLHLRGLWVYSVETGKPLYWQVDAGGYDEGNFVGSNGDDFGWSADDYTHWMPLPASPKGED